MRSVLREKSSAFFEILEYNKKDWIRFWMKYLKEQKEFMPQYCLQYSIDYEEAEKILLEMERPFLDRLKTENEKLRSCKGKAAYLISSRKEELKLANADFTIFMAGALGIEDYSIIKKEGKAIVILDIVSLAKRNVLEKFADICVLSAYKAREELDFEEVKETCQ